MLEKKLSISLNPYEYSIIQQLARQEKMSVSRYATYLLYKRIDEALADKSFEARSTPAQKFTGYSL